MCLAGIRGLGLEVGRLPECRAFRALPDGETGEIVFTTLTRRAMPLIRYRTGDVSRIVPGRCPCGSMLRVLDRVGDRRVRKNIPPPEGSAVPEDWR